MELPVIEALIIVALMIFFFVTEKLPIAVTAMLGCMAFAVTGILTYNEAFSGFSNDTLLMLIGVMIIGDCLFQTGAAELLGKKIIKVVGYNERKLLIIICCIVGVMSAFVSNAATVAMFLPMVRSVAASSNGKIKARNIVMPMSLASMAGGGCTIIGSTPQLVAQALLQDNGLRTLTFFELAKVGVPVLLITIIYFATFGYKIIDKASAHITSPDYLENIQIVDFDNEEMKVTPKMIISIGVLLFVVVAFLFGIWSNAFIALLGAFICISTGCVSQKVAFHDGVNWSSIFVIAGALGVGKGLSSSGAADFLAQVLKNILGENPNKALFVVLLAALCVIMANFFSHTSAVAVLAPVFISFAQEMGYDPTAVVFCVSASISIGMMTPLGTGSHTMTLSEGYKFKDYFTVGAPLNLMAYIAIVTIVIFFVI